jgi:hypothetical protein
VEWELETGGEQKKRYLIDAQGNLKLLGPASEGLSNALTGGQIMACDADTDSSLENELHHFQVMKLQADTWVTGIDPANVEERAKAISAQVYAFFDYRGNSQERNAFTLGDSSLVLWKNAATLKLAETPYGICDEAAVIAITALRSIGIRARMKIVLWDDAAGILRRAHACVEFEKSPNVWMHLDPTYGNINRPDYYRTDLKQKNITVADADCPSVARLGLPDTDGDLLLNPFKDLVLAPSRQGVARPGYSN